MLRCANGLLKLHSAVYVVEGERGEELTAHALTKYLVWFSGLYLESHFVDTEIVFPRIAILSLLYGPSSRKQANYYNGTNSDRFLYSFSP